jgi:hypothetical protein
LGSGLSGRGGVATHGSVGAKPLQSAPGPAGLGDADRWRRERRRKKNCGALKFLEKGPFNTNVKLIISAALQGMRRAELQTLAAAVNTSRMSPPGAKALRAEDDRLVEIDSPVDLAADTVTIASAKAQFRACAAVVKSEDDKSRTLLDLVG